MPPAAPASRVRPAPGLPAPAASRLGAAQVLGPWSLWLLGTAGTLLVGSVLSIVPAAAGRVGGPLWPLWWWDYGWYLGIAQEGYPSGSVTGAHAFAPLWPLLLHATDGRTAQAVLAGAVTVAATALAFLGVCRLDPARRPGRPAVAFACLPGSVTLLMAYPDATALACAVWACVLVRTRPWAAAVLGAVAALARPTGVLIALPLVLTAHGRARWAALGPIAAAAAWHLFLWRRTSDVLAFTSAQRHWGRKGPGVLPHEVRLAVVDLRWRELVALVLACGAVALLVLLWRAGQELRPWAVYASVVVLASLGSGVLDGVARQAMFAFPLVWIAAATPQLRRPGIAALGAAVNVAILLVLPSIAP